MLFRRKYDDKNEINQTKDGFGFEIDSTYALLGNERLTNNNFGINLSDGPHWFLFGMGGSGKDGYVDNIVSSLMKNSSCEELAFFSFDLMKCEFAYLFDSSYSIKNPIDNSRDVIDVLLYLLSEIKYRNHIFKRFGLKTVDEYNKFIKSIPEEKVKLKNIIFFISNYKGLMEDKDYGKEINNLIMEIIDESNSCGISLFITCPSAYCSTNIYNNIVKSNNVSIIGLKVATNFSLDCDIDQNDLINLFGYGDSIVKVKGFDEINVQGNLTSYDELLKLEISNKENSYKNKFDYKQLAVDRGSCSWLKESHGKHLERNVVHNKVTRVDPTFTTSGIQENGEEYSFNLSDGGNWLVGGNTGSGKSVYLVNMMCEMMKDSTPDQLTFILSDPLKVEFTPFYNSPYLMFNPVSDFDDTLHMLNYLLCESNNRVNIFNVIGVQTIDEYNDWVKNNPKKSKEFGYYPFMKNIVFIIEEYAEIALHNHDAKCEKLLCELSKNSQKAGITLVLSTMRCKSDTFTPKILENFPSRIGLKVQNKEESQRIIGDDCLTNLYGKGDSIVRIGSDGKKIRVQGKWIKDNELFKIVEKHKNKYPSLEKFDYNEFIKDND